MYQVGLAPSPGAIIHPPYSDPYSDGAPQKALITVSEYSQNDTQLYIQEFKMRTICGGALMERTREGACLWDPVLRFSRSTHLSLCQQEQ